MRGLRPECGIHCRGLQLHSFVDDILSFLAVGFDDEFLHLFDCQVYGYHFGDAEEGALQDGVGSVAEAYFLRDACCVDVIYGDIVLCKVALDLIGQVFGQLLSFPDGVEQECAAVAQSACNVVHVQVCLDVACYEVGRVHQVCRAYGLVAEAQVRAGEAAGLLGVVGEVCLAVFVGVVADDFTEFLFAPTVPSAPSP